MAQRSIKFGLVAAMDVETERLTMTAILPTPRERPGAHRSCQVVVGHSWSDALAPGSPFDPDHAALWRARPRAGRPRRSRTCLALMAG